MLFLIFALLAAIFPSPSQQQAARLNASLRQFAHARPAIEAQIGEAQAVDVGYRLVEDGSFIDSPPPALYDAADWQETLNATIAIDTQSIADLAARHPSDLTFGRKGLYEAFVRSSADGVLLPVAVYVPQHATAPAPLAVMLHGNPQSETGLLAQPFFRRLADRTGTILIAPWGRGAYDYEGAGTTDVYDAMHAAMQRFPVDSRRVYLVGYSMGGFSVFKIGPKYTHWAAVMDVSGALLNSEVSTIRFAWRDTPVYVVTGKNDQSIPSVYAEETATYLSFLGVPASFYEEPKGEHWLRTLVPALTAAWTDMHAGVTRAQSIPRLAGGAMPSLPSADPSAYKP